MAISGKKPYPRTGDRQTICLKNAIKNPSNIVGDYPMYSDFVKDPTGFERNYVHHRECWSWSSIGTFIPSYRPGGHPM